MAREKKTGLVAAASQAMGSLVRNVRAKYDAAGMGKRMAGWNPPATGPNKAMFRGEKIRDRARDVVRNDWSGESVIQKWATSLIGIGITPRVKRITDTKRKQELVDLWDDFVRDCDADGILSFYGLQTLAVRAWLESGEVFVRRRQRKPGNGLRVPLQVQLIESDYVPMLDTDSFFGLPPGNIIRSGIELDGSFQRVAYWVYRTHPGDGMVGNLSNLDPSRLLRIPVSEMLHMFEPKRPGQLRGVSSLAAILPKLRDIGNYTDAVLLRQQIANLFVAFLTRKLGTEGDQNDPLTGEPIGGGTFDSPLMPLAPGIVQELEDGQDVKFANPPEAGTTYSDYMRTENMTLGSASGLPYEYFSGDIRQVSDRTLRVIINEFRRFAEQRQWQIVIHQLCQPVRDWFADAAAIVGEISMAEIDPVRRVEWAPHGWAYIHPVQDPQGKKIEVDAGFRSRSSVVGERGDDPDVTDAERQADDEREQKLKIGPYSAAAAIASARAPGGAAPAKGANEQDGIAPGEYSGPPNP